MFDSRDYEWADMELVLNGRDVIGVKAIEYEESIEREPLYAKGREPHSIQSGNISYKGKVTMTHIEYAKLVAASPKKSVLWNRGGVATISYGNPSEGVPMIVDTISGIYFEKGGKSTKQGDKSSDVELPFVALKLVNG